MVFKTPYQEHRHPVPGQLKVLAHPILVGLHYEYCLVPKASGMIAGHTITDDNLHDITVARSLHMPKAVICVIARGCTDYAGCSPPAPSSPAACFIAAIAGEKSSVTRSPAWGRK